MPLARGARTDAGRWCRVVCARMSLPLDPGDAACSRRFLFTMSNSAVFFGPGRVAAPGFCFSLFHPPPKRGGGERQRRALQLVQSRLRGATPRRCRRGHPEPPGRRPSALRRGDFRAARPPPRGSDKCSRRHAAASRGRAKPGRSGPATSRACGSHRASAGLPPPRSASERLRRRPSMSEDMRYVATTRYAVNSVVEGSQFFLSCPGCLTLRGILASSGRAPGPVARRDSADVLPRPKRRMRRPGGWRRSNLPVS